MKTYVLYCLLSLSVGSAGAQSVRLIGRVESTDGGTLAGATVRVKPGRATALTDSVGRYAVRLSPPGPYTLVVSMVGYQTNEMPFLAAGDSLQLTIRLAGSSRQLDEVIVAGKSEAAQLRDQGIKADVIDTRKIKQESATLTEVMNRSAGVRVRQTGGLGSAANVMINGFQGRAVKFFKDNIPLDYLGYGFNINLVPVNALERVEIYKGVLPTHLGADALGGAVNLTTRRDQPRYLDLSYEAASFNTHRASIGAFHRNAKSGLFVGFDGFFNHSDNDYRVTVKVIDEFTRNRREATVRRFHDGFTNYYGELSAGVTGKRWADELRLGLTYFYVDKNEQHGALMTEPFGQVSTRQYALVPTLRYRKAWQGGRLTLDQFAARNTITTSRIDTCHCTYDWYGRKTPSAARQGEADSDGSLANITFSYLTSRTYLTYQLNDRYKADLNVVYSAYSRLGSDPFGNRYLYSDRDILSVRAGYQKWAAAIGLESTWKDKWTNNFTVKGFRFQTNGTDAAYASAREEQITNAGVRFGVAEALRYALSANSFLRVSVEYATRLPEQSEVFGDGLFALSNFSLQPERSLNLNVGFRTQQTGRFSLEANAFFRQARDLIVQVPFNLIFLQHQNIEQVRGYGLEADATLTLTNWLTASANVTYQDLRLFDVKQQANLFLEGSRVRNTPYFLGNLGLRSQHSNLLGRGDRLQAYWYYGYVHEYYLESVPKSREAGGFLGLGQSAQIDSDLLIPRQHLHTLGLNYGLPSGRLTVGTEVKNLLDAQLFDNFRVQRAGRSLHLKLRYTLF